MVTTAPPAAVVRRYPGKLYLALGIVLVLLGPVLYFVQLHEKILRTPWYVPALAAAGGVLLLLAILRKPTIWRIAALVLFGLFAGAQWFFLFEVTKTPAYSGPVEVGAPFPTFSSTLADGATTFDQSSLRGDQNTVLVFFRGHW